MRRRSSNPGRPARCIPCFQRLTQQFLRPPPCSLSTDDYFLAREDPRHPRDESGNLNFETIEAVDVERLNADLKSLFTGRAVETPIFDFVVGAPGLKTRRKVLPTGGVLIMEGIFCLNPKLTPHIDRASKFNVFIAPLSPLKLKDGSDSREDIVRLVRRISRDYLHRGNSALHTIRKYDSVRVGELDNIFPFVGEADQMYNSSLLYETNVLKPKVRPNYTSYYMPSTVSLPLPLTRTPCLWHPAPWIVQFAPCTLHPTPYLLHYASCTLHPTSCILHPTSYVLHPTSRSLQR